MQEFLRDIANKTVFIIDNEIDVCLLLKTYLLTKGCMVFMAHSLNYAISHMRQIAPDVVLLGAGMNNNSSLVVERILQATPHVQLIISANEVLYNNSAHL